MKNILLITLLIIILCPGAPAQNFAWAKDFGGADVDEGLCVETDPMGNVYISGTFQGTVDFDPGIGTFYLTATAAQNLFILKLDAAGNLIWAKSIEVIVFPITSQMSVDDSGNITLSICIN